MSSEEERRTLDMLLATPLHAMAILWGKLVAALSYVFLLIIAAIPMASLVFIFGGVTAADMLSVLAMLTLCAITCGAIGLFFSTWLRRSGRATVASYIVLILLMLGSYFLYIVVGVMQQAEPSRIILFANPIAGMASVLSGDVRPEVARSMAGPLMPVAWILSGNATAVFINGSGTGDLPLLRPLWHYTAGIYLLLIATLFAFSVQLLKPIQRWQWARRGLWRPSRWQWPSPGSPMLHTGRPARNGSDT